MLCQHLTSFMPEISDLKFKLNLNCINSNTSFASPGANLFCSSFNFHSVEKSIETTLIYLLWYLGFNHVILHALHYGKLQFAIV